MYLLISEENQRKTTVFKQPTIFGNSDDQSHPDRGSATWFKHTSQQVSALTN